MKKTILILTASLFAISLAFSQITKVENIIHIRGFVNNDIIICDTSTTKIDEETFEIRYPDVIVKNLKSNESSMLSHPALPKLSILYIVPKGKYVYVHFGAEQNYSKHIIKLNENGKIDLTFANNGLLSLTNISEDINFVDIVIDSIDNIYVFTDQTFEDKARVSIYKYNALGKADLSFGNNGLTIVDEALEFKDRQTCRVQNDNIYFTLHSRNNSYKLFTLKDKGKQLSSKIIDLTDLLFLSQVNESLIFAVKMNGIDVYDGDLNLKNAINNIENTMLTDIQYNRFNNKLYIITSGLFKPERISVIYELQKDLSLKRIISAEEVFSASSTKEDFFSSIFFSNAGIKANLSANESEDENLYNNYLIELKDLNR
jgi:hypothetical protein